MMKKLSLMLSVLMLLTLVLGCLPMAAAAASTDYDGRTGLAVFVRGDDGFWNVWLRVGVC